MKKTVMWFDANAHGEIQKVCIPLDNINYFRNLNNRLTYIHLKKGEPIEVLQNIVPIVEEYQRALEQNAQS